MLALVVVVTGCLRASAFVCASDGDCGAAGRCEATHYCSFADPVCGRRYGEAAGPMSNTCVGTVDPLADGGFDVPAPVDGLLDGPPIDAGTGCTDPTVVLGTSDTSGGVTDNIVSSIVDAFGYDGKLTATARCIWVFVKAAPSGNIAVGVYSNGTGNVPMTLQASATIPHPTASNIWVSAVLDHPLAVTTASRLWLGAITSAGTLQTPIQAACPVGAYPLHNDMVASLPATFMTNQTFATCAAPMYLGR